MMRALILVVLLASTAQAQSQSGKTLVAIGGAWGDQIKAYTRVTGHEPQAVKFWGGFNKQWIDYFWHNVHNNMPPDGYPVITFGYDYDKRGIVDINTYKPSQEDAVREIGKTFKSYRRPIYVDIGGECDVGYRKEAAKYVRLFRRFHDIWDEEGVTNVTYVWHAALDIQGENLLPMYPGDKYVDMFASSFYHPRTMRTGTGQIQRTIAFAKEAHRRHKSFGIYESGTPGDVDGKSWERHFVPMFNLVQATNAALLCYNNFGDDFKDDRKKFNFTTGGYNLFGDSQMDRMPQRIQIEWGKKMKEPRFSY